MNLDFFLNLKIKRNSLWYAKGKYAKYFFFLFNNCFWLSAVIVLERRKGMQ